MAPTAISALQSRLARRVRRRIAARFPWRTRHPWPGGSPAWAANHTDAAARRARAGRPAPGPPPPWSHGRREQDLVDHVDGAVGGLDVRRDHPRPADVDLAAAHADGHG